LELLVPAERCSLFPPPPFAVKIFIFSELEKNVQLQASVALHPSGVSVCCMAQRMKDVGTRQTRHAPRRGELARWLHQAEHSGPAAAAMKIFNRNLQRIGLRQSFRDFRELQTLAP